MWVHIHLGVNTVFERTKDMQWAKKKKRPNPL